MLLARRCGVCARPGSSPCATCRAALRPPALAPDPPGVPGLVALLRYEGPGRVLVARVKYGNARSALPGLARALAARLPEPVDVVTWAPTTDARRRSRGFDHAELLAREVARARRVPARRLLRRVDGTAQTGRTGQERRSHAPEMRPTRRLPVGTRVVVVDDVVTTGATLASAVAALHRAGAEIVLPAVLARTPGVAASASRSAR